MDNQTILKIELFIAQCENNFKIIEKTTAETRHMVDSLNKEMASVRETVQARGGILEHRILPAIKKLEDIEKKITIIEKEAEVQNIQTNENTELRKKILYGVFLAVLAAALTVVGLKQ